MRLDWVLVHPFVVLGTWQYPASPTNFSATFRSENQPRSAFPKVPREEGATPVSAAGNFGSNAFPAEGNPATWRIEVR